MYQPTVWESKSLHVRMVNLILVSKPSASTAMYFSPNEGNRVLAFEMPHKTNRNFVLYAINCFGAFILIVVICTVPSEQLWPGDRVTGVYRGGPRHSTLDTFKLFKSQSFVFNSAKTSLCLLSLCSARDPFSKVKTLLGSSSVLVHRNTAYWVPIDYTKTVALNKWHIPMIHSQSHRRWIFSAFNCTLYFSHPIGSYPNQNVFPHRTTLTGYTTSLRILPNFIFFFPIWKLINFSIGLREVTMCVWSVRGGLRVVGGLDNCAIISFEELAGYMRKSGLGGKWQRIYDKTIYFIFNHDQTHYGHDTVSKTNMFSFHFSTPVWIVLARAYMPWVCVCAFNSIAFVCAHARARARVGHFGPHVDVSILLDLDNLATEWLIMMVDDS